MEPTNQNARGNDERLESKATPVMIVTVAYEDVSL